MKTLKSLIIGLLLMCSIAVKAQVNLPITEDFSEMAVPSGWTVSNSWDWYFSNVNETFPSYSNGYIWTSLSSMPSDMFIISPVLTRNGTDPVELSFYQHISIPEYSIVDIKVQISINNGVSWSTVDSITPVQLDTLVDINEQKIINLTDSIGSANQFKVRFFTRIIYGGMGNVRWAIDDISIHEIMPNDAGVISVTNPVSGCGLGNENLIVNIKNFGTATIPSGIPVEYSTDNGANWTSENTTASILPGDTILHTFSTPVDFSVIETHHLLIRTNWASDEQSFNNQISQNIMSEPLVATYPYLEDFESNNGYWYTPLDTSYSSWEWGHPNSTGIIGGASGSQNAWKTNLTGHHLMNENSYILSPCYDFSGLSNPMIEFDVWYEATASAYGVISGMVLQVSTNYGTTWQTLGAAGTGENWYTAAEGWHGSSSEWKHAKHSLSTYGNQNNVKFRFKINVINPSWISPEEGFLFDNIRIYEQPQIDISVTEIETPATGCGMTNHEYVKIKLKNFGLADSPNKIPIAYSINGGTSFVRDTVNYVLTPGEELLYTFFSQPADFSTVGTYHCVALTSIATDGNLLNDTVYRTIIHKPIISSFPYFEDFESSSAEYWTIGSSTGVSNWVLGSPMKTEILPPPSGTHAWTTGLVGNYSSSQNSWVESPCFDLTDVDYPVISMKIAVAMATNDYILVEYSTNSGATWLSVPIQDSYGDSWWYSFSSGWSGSSINWTGNPPVSGYFTAVKWVYSVANAPNVKFRVKITTDSYSNNEGFAFDDFEINNNPLLSIAAKEESDKTGKVLVYPNPCSDYIVISSEKISQGILKISDYLGKQVFQTNIDLSNGDLSITLPELSTGVYRLSIYSKEELFNQALIIK